MQTPVAEAPREEVQQRLLELLAEGSRRVPVAVGILLVVVTLMASQRLPLWIPALWLAAAMAILLTRSYWLRQLPARTDIPLDRRVRLALIFSGLNGCALGLMLGAFPVLQDVERSFFTLLLLG